MVRSPVPPVQQGCSPEFHMSPGMKRRQRGSKAKLFVAAAAAAAGATAASMLSSAMSAWVAGPSAGNGARGLRQSAKSGLHRRLVLRQAENATAPGISQLAEAEQGTDEVAAAKMAMQPDVAAEIAAEALSGAADDPDAITRPAPTQAELQAAQAAAQEDAARRTAAADEAFTYQAKMPKNDAVVDLQTLCDKYGGVDQVYKDHELTTKEGLFKPERLQEMRAWLYDYVANHTAEAEECVVEFEYITGSKLILLGTSHLSRASTEFARQTVRDFRPECLVIERRLGDDSLQRLTIPEITYQDMIMGSTPTQLDQRDSFVDRVRKFHQDRVWLEGTEGWKEIGGEAAQSQEFGSAFEEFALQRINAKPGEDMGPRGGTLILGDADLRPIGMEQTSVGWSTFRPALSDFKKDGPNVPLRDLQMAQTLRAALKTHKRVVAVFGKDHLEGITHLLKQDKRVAVKREGIHIAPPMWLKDLEDGGKKWARAAAAPSSMFYQLAAAVEVAPIGTYLSGQAVMELYKTRQEADARMKKEGPQTDIVAPASSAIADDLISRSELLTPGSEDELKQWLRGENLIGREAGVFPFENPVQRRKAQALRGEKEEAKQDA
eukprot:TRINITY_DN10909_c0_g1_i3.p1 TRINITY_DN10909_c0_g1~~TRINITY_DN10909_c0_g1_i3.p1  ORF type:complete len:606 (+),score=174.03 TRINITY_DN10909_c0_g1_i3:46-1863(+)